MGLSEDYREQLQHPEWQKKRLRILERAGFMCEICGCDDKRFDVHHFEYGLFPWDVSDDKLIVACKVCHKFIHEYGINTFTEAMALTKYREYADSKPDKEKAIKNIMFWDAVRDDAFIPAYIERYNNQNDIITMLIWRRDRMQNQEQRP